MVSVPRSNATARNVPAATYTRCPRWHISRMAAAAHKNLAHAGLQVQNRDLRGIEASVGAVIVKRTPRSLGSISGHK